MWLPTYEKQREPAANKFSGPRAQNETKSTNNQLEEQSLATSATTGINLQKKTLGLSPG
jgi:hypothetical protein